MRRIVTAHNAEGKSFIAVDDRVSMADIWRTQPEKPLGTVPGDEKLLVGRATGGIAYCYILNGELVFLVDTQEVRIKAGDLVVERNTMHSWRNEGTEPVTMAITVVTAVA